MIHARSNLTLARAAMQRHIDARKRRNAAAIIAGSLFSLLAVAAISCTPNTQNQERDNHPSLLASETGQYLTIKR
jgi:hypothetical protein